MPRPPALTSRCGLVGGSVFEQYRERLAAAVAKHGSYVKLHIGDRDGALPYEVPLADSWLDARPYVLQYCNTFGIGPMREAVLSKMRVENALEPGEDGVMITAGASNALSVGCQAVVEPGEEVIVLTPAWPFFFGMVRLAGGVVRELPVVARLYDEPGLDLSASIEGLVSDRTVAIYVNTPNNPSGKTLDRAQLSAIASLAVRHDLWVISDEAYDGMLYDGREHVSIASLPGMAERTLTTFSCSKSFAFAGIRLGWLVAPPTVIAAANKLMIHQFYGPNTPGQAMLAAAIQSRADWLPSLRLGYQRQRDAFVEALGLDRPSPEGTYFVFFDATPYLRGRSFEEFVGACLDAGVSVAPGGDFGEGFESYLRLCFTADSADRVMDAAGRLRGLLGGK